MIFFQYFQFKSHNCDSEGIKAFTEGYWSDDLEKWNWNICQNSKSPYIIQSSQIFRQNPLFFIIQEYVNQRKVLLYLKALFGNNFH